MSQDRYTKIVLTLIAAGLWVLPLIEIGDPVPSAQANPTRQEATQTSQAGVGGPGMNPQTDRSVSRAPTSTLPLRWIVTKAVEETGSFNTFCGTVVIVNNLTNSTITVEVEWFDFNGVSLALRSRSVLPRRNFTFVTDSDVNNRPYSADDSANLADFHGNAYVTSNDPRLAVGAVIYCRDALGFGATTIDSVSQASIQVHPIGATAEIFTAGMPGMGNLPLTAEAGSQ